MADYLVARLRRKQRAGERIVSITAYDYFTALLAREADVDFVLVGDSLGNVVQGAETTVGVTLKQMIYHTRLVCRHFPAEQILLLRSEDLKTDHAATLRRVHEFLGVSPEPIPEPAFVHTQGEQTVSSELRRKLLPWFEDDVLALEQLTGWDLGAWRSP